ncbi:putative MFS transporter [Xylaria bambusicola]|uniref:putative MFS transporter n=1 Tax=Xylaria bambusicola TaxID=326684 RepID=UPI002007F89C|nr:putative MFS transporter [Xylaria bambusicola]KAI0521271.1 putative MFS transporter [Xylaria bambusicola]
MQSLPTLTMATSDVPSNDPGKERKSNTTECLKNDMLTINVTSDKPTVTTSPAHADTGAAKGPSATSIALTMASLCLSAFLSSLDLTIVTTAVPSIVASFHSTSGYIWIGSAFILGFTAVTPIWGSVADIWGRKPIILSALATFLVGSLLCALSPNISTLIGARVVQGIGASGMSVMVNTIICDMFSLRERGLYLAITSIVWAIGSAVGPVLGGVFTARLSWRWCFWINLPIGGVVFIGLLLFLKLPSPSTPIWAGIKAIDWTGSLLCLGGTVMVLLGLDFGDTVHPWSSAAVINLIVFGAVTIGIFVVNEWKFAHNPIVPLHLLSTWSKAAAYGVFAFNAYVFIGITYYLPLYSQSVLGASALTSGLYMLPLIVSCSLSAAVAGVFIQQTGKYRPLMYTAQVLLTLGVGLFIYLKMEENLAQLIVFQIITGVGVGLNIEAPIIAAQASTTVHDTAAVIATMGFLRSIATAISVVVGGVIFQNEMSSMNPTLEEQLGSQIASLFDGGNATANVERISSLTSDQQVTVRQAYYQSVQVVWISYVAFAGFSSFLNLFVRQHHLTSEKKDTVLGIGRIREDPLTSS